MPVRSLSSAVIKWPGRDEVLDAARAWAGTLRAHDPSVQAVYCIGSCARGDYGVGSDLDVLVIIDDADLSVIERRRRYEPHPVPVPADLCVYTRSEWDRFAQTSPLTWARLSREAMALP